MDNIFTLDKYDDDNEVAESINIDDLYERKKHRDMTQLKVFNQMLKRIHTKIKVTSRQKGSEKLCWFVVPEMMLGVPAYDQGTCIGYVMDKLKTDGFRIQYFHPNTLMISWDHWIPNYVIQEIKEKTGKIYDNHGNDLTPSPQQDHETNKAYNMQPGETYGTSDSYTESSRTSANIVYKNKEGVFQRSRKQSDKKYTPINDYKPKGTMVYDEELLFDMNKRYK
jgi:hypothetical protein